MPTVVEHAYSPRGVCLDLMANRSSEILLSGPAGTGKSRACLEKLAIQALRYPGMRGLIVRKTLESLGSTALETWRKHVIPEAILAGMVHFYGGSKEEPAQYRFSNGSRIYLGGMDKPTRIMSSEYDVIYVQEATELVTTDYENLTSRLRNGRMPYQQIISDCNPDKPKHWLKERCDRGDTVILHCKHTDNPVLYNDDGKMTPAGESYILGKLSKLTGVRRKRLLLGLWVSAEGMIYEEEWDESVHLVDAFDIPKEWPRYWSVDFGYIHPFVCQFWAENPDGILYMYREVYFTRRTVTEHARRIMELVAPDGKMVEGAYEGGAWIEPRPSVVVADHDSENREQFETVTGISTSSADKAVLTGVERVQERLKAGRLRYLRGATVELDARLKEDGLSCRTVDEYPGYVWDLGGGRKPREQPVKEQDDGMDATRYMIMERDGGKAVNIRWFD